MQMEDVKKVDQIEEDVALPEYPMTSISTPRLGG